MRKKTIIVGAGISGLMTARILHDQGWPVTLLEKSRGVGGRMATRRIGECVYDHGAQFFTVRQPQFKRWVQYWRAHGNAVHWCSGFANAAGRWDDDGHPRYRGQPGMTAIPKAIAEDLDVRLNSRVTKVDLVSDSWLIKTERGQALEADILVLSAPIPQSLELLADLSSRIDPDTLNSLNGIKYDRCIALLLELEQASLIPEPGGMQIRGEMIDWLADNVQKGISSHCHNVTVHSSAAFSQKYWESDDVEIAEKLIGAAQKWLGASVRSYQLHRWCYSKPSTTYPERFIHIDEPGHLLFIGDAFAGPRVEGAALSGLSAADDLGTQLSCLTWLA
jgi:predicted NAD/FAD-dependent oxidoreductase